LLASWIALAITEPSAAQPNDPARVDDFFIDDQGRLQRFSTTYQSWFGPERHPRQYARAAMENGLITILEMAFYWYDPQSNSVDWQFPDVSSKLQSASAVRFDDNLMRTNYLYHPFAGQSHYLFTRVNGFSVGESFLTAAAFSTAYEMLLEWRELVSINDLIVTPVGGTAVGEFFNQLGGYLNSEPPHAHLHVRQPAPVVVRDGAEVTLGLPQHLHESFDEPEYPVLLPPDTNGLSSAYHHAFRLTAGLEAAGNGTSRWQELYQINGRFQLVAMPGFLRPGGFHRWFGTGNFTSSRVRVAFAGRESDIEVHFDSDLFGHYGQNVRSSPGGRTGFANELGIGTGLRYLDRRLFGRTDQLGIVHLLRPVDRAWFLFGPARLELALDLSPDFASIHSAAYESYVRRFGTDGTKSSLIRHGYLHTWGVSGGAVVALSAGDARIEASGRYGHYESIEGLERNQEEVSVDSHGTETVRDLAFAFELEPRGSPLSARFELAETRRGSRLEPDLHATRTHRRVSVGLGLAF
jgi:hypothetical protein